MLICGFRATTKQGPALIGLFASRDMRNMNIEGRSERQNQSSADGSIATWAEPFFAYREGLYDRDGESVNWSVVVSTAS